MQITVGHTGPGHDPTTETKWYAQIRLTHYDMLPIGVATYSFGPSPEKALESLLNSLQAVGFSIE